MFSKKYNKETLVDETKKVFSDRAKRLFDIMIYCILIIEIICISYQKQEISSTNAIYDKEIGTYEKKIKDLQDQIKTSSASFEANSIKERSLSDVIFAYRQAISKQDAIASIDQKIKFVKSNTVRIRENYINSNPDVKNLDASVINDLLKVINENAQNQLLNLNKAKKILVGNGQSNASSNEQKTDESILQSNQSMDMLNKITDPQPE